MDVSLRKIAQMMIDAAEFEWSKLVLHVEIYQDSVECVFRVYSGEDSAQFFLPTARLFWDLLEETTTPGQDKWTTFDFELFEDGRYTTNFGYEKTEWMKLVDSM